MVNRALLLQGAKKQGVTVTDTEADKRLAEVKEQFKDKPDVYQSFLVRSGLTEKQLRAYGTFELQVLEELLRRPAGTDSARLLREVAEKICRRIEWPTPVPDGEIGAFLREFYTAERGFLEREQLFGKPRPDKHYQSETTSGGPSSG